MAAAQPNDLFDDGNQHEGLGSRDARRIGRQPTSDEQVRGRVIRVRAMAIPKFTMILQYPETLNGDDETVNNP